MTITIMLDHADIATPEEDAFRALFFVVQTYAKLTRAQLPTNQFSKMEDMMERWAERKLADVEKKSETPSTEKAYSGSPEKAENSSEPKAETPPVENPINRKDIEAEIKQIALDGKEKGASKKIKEIIQTYGVEKLSDVPDDKMPELLEKVKAI